MAINPNQLGGYRIEFVKVLDDRLKCRICKFVLRSPFQTECGHRYCESCIKDIINKGNKKCPEDNTVLSGEKIFRDGFCNREILMLECFCTNKNQGCKWNGKLSTLEDHFNNECLFTEVTCVNEGCNMKMLRGVLEKHMKEDCKFKKIPCEYCGLEQAQPLLEAHYTTTCPKCPLPCQKGCGEKVPREKMEHHLTRDCPNAESTCPLVGQCDFQGSRAGLKQHLSEKQVEHTRMLTDKISNIETNMAQVNTTTTAVRERQEALDNQSTNYREELASLRDNVATLRASVERIKDRPPDEIQEYARPVSPREEKGAERPDEIAEIKKRLSTVEDQLKQLQLRDRAALGRGQIGGGQPGDGENVNLNATVSELSRKVESIEQQNAMTDVRIADHDIKMTMLETISYDGVFIWKIDDFGRRYQDGVSGRCLSSYSPQFYVGRYGYKVCARVYLNGDGMGKGTHLSLFFVLMRGEYDALLPWPFQQKVSFKLIDQGGDQHIIDSFRPDPNSSSFQRPTSNMNIASGCPLFVPKQVLHSRGFIKDDSAYIKITVDTTGMTLY